jgi:hypothetical protein
MHSSLKQSVRNGLLVAVASLGLVGVGYVFAAPTAPPPGSNLSLPLTRGAGAEIKAGALTVQGGLTVTNTLTVDRICLAGDCQTEWPSGGGLTGSMTLNGAGYHSSSYCYGYAAYEQLTYYRYGSLYNNNQYNCGPTSFSLTLPAVIPSGSTPVASGGVVWCHGGTNNYSPNSPATYITDNYYNYRIQATVNSITNNNNGTVTINGNCKFLAGGTNYAYMAMRAENLQLLY